MVISRLGGTKEVRRLTGLSKGRISQWRIENRIPTPWEKFLRAYKPAAFDENEEEQTDTR